MTNRTNVNNGIATLTIHETLQPGTYTINGHYNGSDNYEESEGTGELEILKKTTLTTLSSTNNSYFVTEDVILNIQVKDANNNSITTGTYILYENNIQKRTGIINGNNIAVNLGKKSAGTKTYKVIYQENETYLGSTSNELEITIDKINTETDIISANLYTNEYSVVYAQVTQKNGPPLQGIGRIYLKINGRTIKNEDNQVLYGRPDEMGEVELIFNHSGNINSTYTITAYYLGTSYYENSQSENLSITPETYLPEITAFNDLIVDQIDGGMSEDSMILFNATCSVDSSTDFFFTKEFLNRYLRTYPLLLVAQGEYDVIGYIIGLTNEDSEIIQHILESGLAEEYYRVCNNDETADGLHETIFTQSNNNCELVMDINFGEGSLAIMNNVSSYDLYLFGSDVVTSYNVE